MAGKQLPQTLPPVLILCLALLVASPARGFLRPSTHPSLSVVATDIDPSTTIPNFARLPLPFVPDTGQTTPAARFQAYSIAGTLSFTPAEVVLRLPAPPPTRHVEAALPILEHIGFSQSAIHNPKSAIVLRFQGANPAPQIVGVDPLPGIVNYFIGNDPARWRTNLPTYAGIVYRQLYPGIDLHYEGTSRALKGTFTIAPGADASRIRWRYAGAKTVKIDETSGDLLVSLPAATDLDATQSEIPNSKSQIRNPRPAMPTSPARPIRPTSQR